MAYDVNDITNYIIESARARGIDPNVALAVARSEGLRRDTWQSDVVRNGVREPSFGPFQMLVGGPGTGFPSGLGNEMMRRTGLDPSDPANAKDTIDFALDHAARSGWGQWYGAAKAGIDDFQGIGVTPPTAVAENAPTPPQRPDRGFMGTGTPASYASLGDQLMQQDFDKMEPVDIMASGTTAPPIRMTDRIVSDFGWRDLSGQIPGRGMDFHEGLDIARTRGEVGTGVFAFEGGVVTSIQGLSSGLGKVTVRQPDGAITEYLHVDPVADLQIGMQVRPGQMLAQVGPKDGHSSGPHLDIRKKDANGEWIDLEPAIREAWVAERQQLATARPPSAAEAQAARSGFMAPEADVDPFAAVQTANTDLRPEAAVVPASATSYASQTALGTKPSPDGPKASAAGGYSPNAMQGMSREPDGVPGESGRFTMTRPAGPERVAVNLSTLDPSVLGGFEDFGGLADTLNPFGYGEYILSGVRADLAPNSPATTASVYPTFEELDRLTSSVGLGAPTDYDFDPASNTRPSVARSDEGVMSFNPVAPSMSFNPVAPSMTELGFDPSLRDGVRDGRIGPYDTTLSRSFIGDRLALEDARSVETVRRTDPTTPQYDQDRVTRADRRDPRGTMERSLSAAERGASYLAERSGLAGFMRDKYEPHLETLSRQTGTRLENIFDPVYDDSSSAGFFGMDKEAFQRGYDLPDGTRAPARSLQDYGIGAAIEGDFGPGARRFAESAAVPALLGLGTGGVGTALMAGGTAMGREFVEDRLGTQDRGLMGSLWDGIGDVFGGIFGGRDSAPEEVEETATQDEETETSLNASSSSNSNSDNSSSSDNAGGNTSSSSGYGDDDDDDPASSIADY